MKYIAIITSLALSACSQDKEPVPAMSTISMGPWSSLKYFTVTIDGNDYLATKSGDFGWALCPKLPPKAERQE